MTQGRIAAAIQLHSPGGARVPPMRAHWRHMAIMTKLCFFWPTRDQNPIGKSIGSAIFGRLLVEQFALCYQSVVCLSVCLSVYLSCPVCDAGVLWPNAGWMDQNETWQAGRPRPWPHCVRWGTQLPLLQKGAEHPT